MKKSICLIAAAAVVGVVAVLIKKRSKTNVKIVCQCCRKSDKTEQAITSEDTKDCESSDITLPVESTNKPISLSVNNASLGNVSYSIVIK